MRQSVDAIVIGGGPAGAAAATRLAQRGQRVLVLEGERFPRFHIGESLLPLGDAIFHELGCSELVARAGFVQKFGAQLLTPCGSHRVLFDFQQAGTVDPPWTFQVRRAEFDALLLLHAEREGAEVRFARAREYRRVADGFEVDCMNDSGAASTVRCRVLIDASGRAGFVARREGVRIADAELKKASIYAHFRGVPTDAGVRAGDTRIVSLPDLGWMWFIPLRDGVVSVGVVLDMASTNRAKGDPATVFAEAVSSAPLAMQLLANAERVGDFGVESGFSYRASRYCGDGWFLAGDAGSFLDPVFSTGVLMALRSGVEAADAAVAACLRPAARLSARLLAPLARAAAVRRRYDRTLRRRYDFVRRFVLGFYDAGTRDVFFAPRPTFGLTRAVTKVLAGGFDLGWLDRLRLRLFFLIGRLQRRFDLVPRLAEAVPAAPMVTRAAHGTVASDPGRYDPMEQSG